MTERVISAIETALKKGQRVELTMDQNGTVKIRTVTRKELKP